MALRQSHEQPQGSGDAIDPTLKLVTAPKKSSRRALRVGTTILAPVVVVVGVLGLWESSHSGKSARKIVAVPDATSYPNPAPTNQVSAPKTLPQQLNLTEEIPGVTDTATYVRANGESITIPRTIPKTNSDGRPLNATEVADIVFNKYAAAVTVGGEAITDFAPTSPDLQRDLVANRNGVYHYFQDDPGAQQEILPIDKGNPPVFSLQQQPDGSRVLTIVGGGRVGEYMVLDPAYINFQNRWQPGLAPGQDPLTVNVLDAATFKVTIDPENNIVGDHSTDTGTVIDFFPLG